MIARTTSTATPIRASRLSTFFGPRSRPIGDGTLKVLLLFGLFLLLLIAALVGKSMIAGKKAVTVMVEGVAQHYPLKPFSSANVYDARQNKVATIKRGLFGVKLLDKAPDTAVRLK